MFAETNRMPFDLPESEQELAGGYNVEYSSMKFALFFMGEYANMIAAVGDDGDAVPGRLDAAVCRPGPAGGDALGRRCCTSAFFWRRCCSLMFMMIWVRWMWPRFRYDQLMDLGWRRFIPLALANIVVTAVVLWARTEMIVKRRKLNLWERLYLPAMIGGFKVTLRHFFKKKVTMQYPEEKWVVPEGYRGAPYLVKDQDGRTKCVSCQLCEFVCPPKAIRITPPGPAGAPEAGNVEKAPKEFEINMLRCIFCGFCQEVCPEEAIFLMKDYSLTGTSRAEMVYDKEKLLALGGVHQDKIRKWKHKADEARAQGVEP